MALALEEIDLHYISCMSLYEMLRTFRNITIQWNKGALLNEDISILKIYHRLRDTTLWYYSRLHDEKCVPFLTL